MLSRGARDVDHGELGLCAGLYAVAKVGLGWSGYGCTTMEGWAPKGENVRQWGVLAAWLWGSEERRAGESRLLQYRGSDSVLRGCDKGGSC